MVGLLCTISNNGINSDREPGAAYFNNNFSLKRAFNKGIIGSRRVIPGVKPYKNKIMNTIFIESPTQEEQQFFEDKLLRFNESKIDGYSYDNFIYKIIDNSNSMVAGINCEIGGGWLYIVGIWVAEHHRGKGYGEKLLAASEKKAMEKDCHSSYLFTYDFQAPDFYKKKGYKVFGKLDKFCDNHAKIFMKKRLA